jgi:hypothetical protein
METGLFEIQADHLHDLKRQRQSQQRPQQINPAGSGWAYSVEADASQPYLGLANGVQATPGSGPKAFDPAIELATCFLRLANLPSFPLDRLSRYEAILWRQASQILFALDALDRRKPQERLGSWRSSAEAVLD